MQVATAQEALFMACEMESSAIQLYTRALSLMEQLGRQDEPLYDHLTLMLADEQEHLAQFRALGGRDDLAQERRVALSAAADNILFEGGLMGAARAGLLRDVESMLRFAMLAEETSASKYREFASLAASPGARETLERIASEEDRHLSELRTHTGIQSSAIKLVCYERPQFVESQKKGFCQRFQICQHLLYQPLHFNLFITCYRLQLTHI